MWLLRLFPQFARLQMELEQESGARIAAEDKVRGLQAELLEARAALVVAQDKTVHSVETVADWLSQSMFGRKIYGQAPELSRESQDAELIARPRTQGRALVQRMEEEFNQKLAAAFEGEPQ